MPPLLCIRRPRPFRAVHPGVGLLPSLQTPTFTCCRPVAPCPRAPVVFPPPPLHSSLGPWTRRHFCLKHELLRLCDAGPTPRWLGSACQLPATIGIPRTPSTPLLHPFGWFPPGWVWGNPTPPYNLCFHHGSARNTPSSNWDAPRDNYTRYHSATHNPGLLLRLCDRCLHRRALRGSCLPHRAPCPSWPCHPFS